MPELALAVAVVLFGFLYLLTEERHASERVAELDSIIGWMKCQERIDRIRDRQIEILTRALTRSENPDVPVSTEHRTAKEGA